MATAAWGRGEPASFALSAGESAGIDDHGGFDASGAKAHILGRRLDLMRAVADARLQDCSRGAAATVIELDDVKRQRDELEADLNITKESLEECLTQDRIKQQHYSRVEARLELHQTSGMETVKQLETELRSQEKARAEQDRKIHMAETRASAFEAEIKFLKKTMEAERAKNAAEVADLREKLRSVESAAEAADANCLRLLAQERNEVAVVQKAFSDYQREIAAEGYCQESEDFRKIMETSRPEDAPTPSKVRDEL